MTRSERAKAEHEETSRLEKEKNYLLDCESRLTKAIANFNGIGFLEMGEYGYIKVERVAPISFDEPPFDGDKTAILEIVNTRLLYIKNRLVEINTYLDEEVK